MTTKVCSKCQTEKTLDQFQPDPRYRLGVVGQCKACDTARMREWRANNSAKAKEKRRANYLLNKEKVKEQAKFWRQNNADRFKLGIKNWAKANKPRRAMQRKARQAEQMNATPAWLSAIELAQIQEMYDVAAAKTMQTGIKHHVDHIHPLQGNGFTGLHVPWNLRVITAFENCSKHNKPDKSEQHLFWEGAF